jgi:hypothetical protein
MLLRSEYGLQVCQVHDHQAGDTSRNRVAFRETFPAYDMIRSSV